ncbi:hypothetical protein [Marinobacter nauticus]|uniref:hypothetical protein n=1 Tax=Marinobacter nauticus TaxID=2743 RepID=UPI00129B0842|nr:hypothetical protein [Marinobacter nauticus]
MKYAELGAEINAKTLAAYHKRQEPKRQAKREAIQKFINMPDKRCAKCGEVKPKSNFGKDNRRLDGHRPYCKPCHAAGNRKWREERPDVAAEASARWARNNRERVAEKARRYYHRNTEKCRDSYVRWRQADPEKARAIDRKSRSKRRQRAEVRVHDSVGNRIRGSLRAGKDWIATFDLLDYTLDELMTHLERQFVKGMSWDNYGEWHIDHITPLSSFTISGVDDPELRRAWCLTNLRPIWARDNLSKRCKITHLL